MSAPERVNILLVDDQPARLMTYEAVLSDLGENLVRAQSGREALRHLMQQDFAVVLLDVYMPELDGFEVANLMFAHPRSAKTPVIFVTGVHISELDRLKGYAVGAVDYVNVPVVPQILRTKVAVFVELYRKRQEQEELARHLADAHAQLSRDHSELQVHSAQELANLNRTLQSANAELLQANEQMQREIAERVRAQNALLKADRHKDEFLGILAHELRNPLGATQTALQAARTLGLAHPPLERLHEIMQRQLGVMTALVHDLLDIAGIARGKLTLARECVSVASIVEAALETVSPLVQQRQHQLMVEFSDRKLRIEGDPLRLAQVFGNVLGNAVKYTEPGGRITLTVRQEGREVALSIRDTGIGIAGEELPGIFDLFAQVHPEHESRLGGLGIGLALVHRLLQMHGGRIRAHSEGIGKGSEFVIHLPLLLEVGSAENTQTTASSASCDLPAGEDAPAAHPR
jgi:signal transduction histidine kinase